MALTPAPLVNRIFASILDSLIMLVIQVIVGFALYYANGLYSMDANLIDILNMLINVSFAIVLFIRPLVKDGTTPGKRILNIKVVDFETEGPISWGQAILREFIMKLVTILLFPLAIISYYFINKDKRFFHDQLTQTLVVWTMSDS